MLLEDSIGFMLLRAVLYFPRLWKWRRSGAGIQDGDDAGLTPVEQRAYPAAASTEETESGEWTVLRQPTCQVLQIYMMSYCTHTLIHLHTKTSLIHYNNKNVELPLKLRRFNGKRSLTLKGRFASISHSFFLHAGESSDVLLQWLHGLHCRLRVNTLWCDKSLLQQRREASVCAPNRPRHHFLSRSHRKWRRFPPSSVRRGLGRWFCRGGPGPRWLVFPAIAANPSSDVLQVRPLLTSILDPWRGGARAHHLPRLS